ncbi:MAG: DUF6062 family protein [Spirochaetota bacterium]
MKYELQTIPVWDAYEHEADCPLCFLQDALETEYQRFFLGNAVMAPEMRVEVNKIGFCAEHFDLLFRGANRLGLGLMTQTYLEARCERFQAARRALERAAHAENERTQQRGNSLRRRRGTLRGLLGLTALSRHFSGRRGGGRGRGGRFASRVSELIEALRGEQETCMICRRLETSIANYAFTILTLYRSEPEFVETFRASRGFCLPHLRTMLEVSTDVLSDRDLSAWLTDLFDIHDSSVDELSKLLEEMTQRYDYRSTEPVTEALKASVPRAIEKLVGRFRR